MTTATETTSTRALEIKVSGVACFTLKVTDKILAIGLREIERIAVSSLRVGDYIILNDTARLEQTKYLVYRIVGLKEVLVADEAEAI